MSAKIQARDGRWSDARKVLDSHRHRTTDEGVSERREDVEEVETGKNRLDERCGPSCGWHAMNRLHALFGWARIQLT
jgi:hypothetical protein